MKRVLYHVKEAGIVLLAPVALLLAFLGMVAIALIAWFATAGLYLLVVHLLLSL